MISASNTCCGFSVDGVEFTAGLRPKARKLTDQEQLCRQLSHPHHGQLEHDQPRWSHLAHASRYQARCPCSDVFENMVLPESGQGLLHDAPRWEKVLKYIPDPYVRESLSEEWTRDEARRAKPQPNADPNLMRWKQLKATVDKKVNKMKKSKNYKERIAAESLERCATQIIILHTYPRLDVNVSTHRNHLLKSPFVIHPKTGKVCVPIFDVANSHNFDPDAVPNLRTLMQEIDEFDARNAAEGGDEPTKRRKVDDGEKTSLKSYVDLFEKSFLNPCKTNFAPTCEM